MSLLKLSVKHSGRSLLVIPAPIAPESSFEAIPDCKTVIATPEMFRNGWSGFVDQHMDEGSSIIKVKPWHDWEYSFRNLPNTKVQVLDQALEPLQAEGWFEMTG